MTWWRRWLGSCFAVVVATANGTNAAASIGAGSPSPSASDEPAPRSQANAPWWTTFQDAYLAQHIAATLAANQDLQAAHHRLAQAQALAVQAKGALWPSLVATVQGSASALVGGFGGGGGGGGNAGAGGGFIVGADAASSPNVLYNVTGNLGLRYPLDITGAQHLTYRAQKQGAAAQKNQRDSLGLALAAQAAAAYFDAVMFSQQQTILGEQLEANERLLELIQLRFERGEATGLEVLQQRQQAAATRALLPQARAQARVQLQQLAVLRGASPFSPYPIAKQLPPLPTAPPPPQSPDDLLQHRPDLRAQEAAAKAAHTRARIAFRQHFPTLEVSGSGGFQLLKITDTNTNENWNASVNLSVPVFNGGALNAAVDAAEAEARAAQAQLQQAHAAALGEVAAARVQETEFTAQLAAHRDMLEAARLALDESRQRYLRGLTPYLNVLTALQAWQQAQLSVLQSQRAVLGARLQLLTALAGPWTHDLTRRYTTAPRPRAASASHQLDSDSDIDPDSDSDQKGAP